MDAPETTIYNAVIIASVVIGIILLYFFISIIWQLRQNLSIQKKGMLREIAGLEKERARIAADFHDELGPILAGLKMRINSFNLTDPEDEQELSKTNDQINDIIRRMRQISFNLMPVNLLKKGLVKTIEEYIDFLEVSGNIRFTFTHELNCKIPEEKAINIYRIVQEIVHNAIKHSGASEIKITLKNSENTLFLSIVDNGIGFVYKNVVRQSTGIGLGSISNRNAMVGGKMYLRSEINKGTQYLFDIPI